MTAPKKRSRLTTTQQGYGWDYQQARAALLANRPGCHWCGAPATTADHYPPKSAGGHWSSMVPACRKCNFGHVSLKRWNGTQIVKSRDW